MQQTEKYGMKTKGGAEKNSYSGPHTVTFMTRENVQLRNLQTSRVPSVAKGVGWAKIKGKRMFLSVLQLIVESMK